jgi:hypothetical protein
VVRSAFAIPIGSTAAAAGAEPIGKPPSARVHLLPRRRDRQRERVKKLSKNTFPTKKRAAARPASKAHYKIRVMRKAPLPAQMP